MASAPGHSAQNNANIQYILEHRGVVEGHILKHKATWAPVSPTSDSDAPVQVFVRVRPLLKMDHEASSFSLLAVQESRLVHVTHPTIRWAGGRIATKTYEADAIFSDETPNSEVYGGMGVTKELERLLSTNGSELSVVAYGQTGTGKTYTTTSIEEQLAGELFEHSGPGYSVKATISILEIRGSSAYDLLSEPPLGPVKISVAGVGTTYQGLTVHDVTNKEELLAFIKRGRDLRMTRSTSKNDVSSRSHSIVNIKVTQTSQSGPDIQSTINVVDLAGSERSSLVATHDSERVKEAINTNKSLAALKDCIRARLTEGIRIPWRADKLTMALKGAFEGKTDADGSSKNRLFVIACISPSVLDIEDTLNTLKYVTPFQLSASAATEATVRQQDLGEFNDPKYWSHEQSRTYIERQMPKWFPVFHRLLPLPTSTIASLLPLDQEALIALIDTPAANEVDGSKLASAGGKPIVPPGKTLAPSARNLEAARNWVKQYQPKLQAFVQQAEDLERKLNAGDLGIAIVAKASAGVSKAGQKSNKAALMKVLDGKSFSANETGPVQRVFLDENGTTFAAIEKLEGRTGAKHSGGPKV